MGKNQIQPSSSHRLYWTLQCIGWLVYGSVNFASLLSFNYTDSGPLALASASLIASAQLIVLTHLLRLVAKRRRWLTLPTLPLALRLFGLTLLIATFSQFTMSAVAMWVLGLFTLADYSLLYLGINIFQVEIWLVIWTLIYVCVQFFRNYKSEEIEKWRLAAAVKDAELIALKAQINPHFIFNCLNNIRALVLEDPTKARDAITKLSDLLRSSIQSNQAEQVPLAQELATVRDYLALEAIHMESRLRYTIESPPEADSIPIPPMAIQLLAENAIKHSLSQLPAGGNLDIHIQKTDTALQISVRNTGQLSLSPAPSTGIGTKNIRDRLALLNGPDASFALVNESPTHVRAQIEIPLPPKGPST